MSKLRPPVDAPASTSFGRLSAQRAGANGTRGAARIRAADGAEVMARADRPHFFATQHRRGKANERPSLVLACAMSETIGDACAGITRLTRERSTSSGGSTMWRSRRFKRRTRCSAAMILPLRHRQHRRVGRAGRRDPHTTDHRSAALRHQRDGPKVLALVVVVGLSIIALFAITIPVRRAARIDPTIALTDT